MWTALAYPLAEPQLYAVPPIPSLLIEITTLLPVRRHHRHFVQRSSMGPQTSRVSVTARLVGWKPRTWSWNQKLPQAGPALCVSTGPRRWWRTLTFKGHLPVLLPSTRCPYIELSLYDYSRVKQSLDWNTLNKKWGVARYGQARGNH